MNELLNVNEVSISFRQYVQGLKQKNLEVITDLSLDVREGEIVAILGSSGSGKSLLAHSILGILPENANQQGKIIYKGQLLDEELKDKLRGDEIALIPQSVNFLDPLMKISDQVIGDCSEEEYPQKKKKQEELFKQYNLDKDVEDMYPFQLSGGMARRVLVSTALMNNPKLVIADEPTPGLDEKAVAETEVANRIAIFYAGYVIEIALTSDFKEDGENLLHPYTKALFKALPENGFELTEGHQPLHGDIPEGCPYFSRCPNSLAKCEHERPHLINLGDKKVRCFQYEKEEL